MFYFVFHDDVAGQSKHDGVARPLASHLDAENDRVTIFSILSETYIFHLFLLSFIGEPPLTRLAVRVTYET